MAEVAHAVPGNATPSGTVLCEAREITHDFLLPNGHHLRVLADVGLVIRSEEVVALLGPSGCGKSTLLRILAGVIPPTHGDVFYRGQKLAGLNPGVAIVFQSFALFPWMTVRQNIEVVLRARHVAPEVIHERASRAINTVGLSGFEDAYPRELSGGMKQRAGIARALSVNPEILFMDEPFSQVDALTAEALRAEVIDFWSAKDRHLSTVLLVSHDIREVVYLADRIVLMGANPGRVFHVVENRLPRPREYRSPEFLALVDQLHELITGQALPDVAEAAVAEAVEVREPLPNATAGEIIGILEHLDSRGGRGDLFQIASEINQEFGHVIAVVKAAEMLDFVDSPRRMVVLEPDGRRFVNADPTQRHTIWREHLLKLRLFRDIYDMLQRQPEHRIPSDVVLETIVLDMPQENYERIFATLVSWARFGDLFSFDEDRQELLLD